MIVMIVIQLLEDKLAKERETNDDRVKKKIHNRFSVFFPELSDSDSHDDDNTDDDDDGDVFSIGDIEEASASKPGPKSAPAQASKFSPAKQPKHNKSFKSPRKLRHSSSSLSKASSSSKDSSSNSQN